MSKTTKSPWPEFSKPSLEAWEKSAAKSAPNGNVDALGWDTPCLLYTSDAADE